MAPHGQIFLLVVDKMLGQFDTRLGHLMVVEEMRIFFVYIPPSLLSNGYQRIFLWGKAAGLCS